MTDSSQSLANKTMMGWSRYLRQEALEAGYQILDTTEALVARQRESWCSDPRRSSRAEVILAGVAPVDFLTPCRHVGTDQGWVRNPAILQETQCPDCRQVMKFRLSGNPIDKLNSCRRNAVCTRRRCRLWLSRYPWHCCLYATGAFAYLILGASTAWAIPQEREAGIHSITGEPFVWFLAILPIVAFFFVLNVVWGAVIVRRQWQAVGFWLLTAQLWLGAMAIDLRITDPTPEKSVFAESEFVAWTDASTSTFCSKASGALALWLGRCYILAVEEACCRLELRPFHPANTLEMIRHLRGRKVRRES